MDEMLRILMTYIILTLFGLTYNTVVSWLDRHGYLEGYSSLAVVGGVMGVLAGLALIDWQFTLLALGAFACAGTPMVLGSIWRYASRRREAQESMRRLE